MQDQKDTLTFYKKLKRLLSG